MKVKAPPGQLRLPIFPSALLRVMNLKLWQRENLARARGYVPQYSSVENPICAGPGGSMPAAPYLKRIWGIIEKVKARDPSAEPLILAAFELAWHGHSGQMRKDGRTPYIDHCVSVAEIVAEWGMGAAEISAALCHDLKEQGKIARRLNITRGLIEDKLGTRVSDLVEGTSELGKSPDSGDEDLPLVHIHQKYLEHGTRDLASIVIKLADRLHNMRTLAYIEPEKRVAKAKETLRVYAKIADILGMWEVKRELEDLAYRYINPERYAEIEGKRQKLFAASEGRIDQIITAIRAKVDMTGLRVEIYKERRHIYELQERMEKRGLALESLTPSDVWRVNIVVPEKRDCHAIQGLIHDDLFPPVQGEIHNFIAEPRPNGHQFLHSYMKVPRFGRLLVQIRDQEMQKNYRLGVLSGDWRRAKNTMLRAMTEYLRSEGVTEGGFYDMFVAASDSIVVTTRAGAKIDMPGESYPLDFAAVIHTDIFLQAADAVINGRPAPLSQVLRDGDEVFINKDPESAPRLEWVYWIRTSKALAKLQEYLRRLRNKKIEGLDQAEQGEKIIMGKAWELFGEEAHKHYLSAGQLGETEFFKNFLQEKGFRDVQDFVLKAGLAKVRMDKVLSEFMARCEETIGAQKEAGNKKVYRIRIKGEDRSGFEHEVKGTLRKLGINFKASFSYNYTEGSKMMGDILLAIEGVPGAAGGIQQLQTYNIARRTPGVVWVTVVSPKEMINVMDSYIQREK